MEMTGLFIKPEKQASNPFLSRIQADHCNEKGNMLFYF